MRPIVLLVFALLHLGVTPRVSASNNASLETSFEHHGVRVRVISGNELKDSMIQLRQWTLDSLVAAEERLDMKLLEDVDLYFDTRPLYHNGLTTVVPRNRISVNTEAPELNSSIGITRFYIFETLVHEWAHMLSIQEHRGLFKGLSWVLGNTSRPNGSWPRWIHEGLAVWTEKKVGGRPLSGSIDFDLRRLAEYEKRTQKPALNNSQLDGQWELAKFRSGQVPYSFGYLLFEHLSEKKNFSLGRFSEGSSNSLGLSFRKAFEEHGVSIDRAFEEAHKEWSATPLRHATTPAQLLSRAQDIRGLKSFGKNVAWIEVRADTDVRLVSTNGQERNERKWPLDLLVPLEATPLSVAPAKEKWAVLVDSVPAWLRNSLHSSAAPSRRHLAIFYGEETSLHCVFKLDERLREVEIGAEKILWVVSTSDGRNEVFEAKWNDSCQTFEKRSVFRSEAFERLTAAAFAAESVIVTRNFPSTETYDERILDSKNRRLVGSSSLLTQYAPHAGSDLGVVFERSRTYWGPLLTRSEKNQVKSFRLPMRTGAFEAVLDPEGRRIYYIEKLWDTDEVLSLSVDDPSIVADALLRWEDQKTDIVPDTTNPSSETRADAVNHGPLDNIWPHFWIPSLLAGDGAWIVAGQTFYSDLTQTWNGATLVGFNTLTERPFGNTSLSWIPSSQKTRPQIDVGVSYDPRDVSYFGLTDQNVQDRASASLSFLFPYALSSRWRGNISFGYLASYYGQLGRFDESREYDPFVRLSLRSPYGQNPYSSVSRLSESPGFFYFDQRARWMQKLDLRANVYGLFRSSRRSRVLVALQGAHTSVENFPRSYYLWGGAPLFSTNLEGNYMNRGFPLQGFVARNLVRGSTEWIFGLWDPRVSLSWNRFRLQNVDLRLIGESLTWDPILGSKFRLGKTFASSAGAEVDILGSGLHYISYKLSLGAFQGFGDSAETRYTAQLRVGLDL